MILSVKRYFEYFARFYTYSNRADPIHWDKLSKWVIPYSSPALTRALIKNLITYFTHQQQTAKYERTKKNVSLKPQRVLVFNTLSWTQIFSTEVARVLAVVAKQTSYIKFSSQLIVQKWCVKKGFIRFLDPMAIKILVSMVIYDLQVAAGSSRWIFKNRDFNWSLFCKLFWFK